MLAGVNGAGKSSVGGGILAAHGLTWFNPDAFARELMSRSGMSREAADATAWAYGKAKLEEAMAEKANFAFETTLGGTTMTRLLAKAALTHDVTMMFCGLASIEMHLDRVKLRVRSGGHDIPEPMIRRRWDSARRHLIELLPRLAHLQAFDNSKEAAADEVVPYPVLVLEMKRGRMVHPHAQDADALAATPDWAKPILAAALRLDETKRTAEGRLVALETTRKHRPSKAPA